MTSACTANDPLNFIVELLDFCSRSILKLHPQRCVFSKIFWYGRVITYGGVRFDPTLVDGIREIDTSVSEPIIDNVYVR